MDEMEMIKIRNSIIALQTGIRERNEIMESRFQQLDAIEKAIALGGGQFAGGGQYLKKGVYNSIGEQLIDVVAMEAPNIDPVKRAAASERLQRVQAAASGANETVGPEGGYLVQTDQKTVLDRGAIETGLLSRRCFEIPLSRDADSLELNLPDETSRANGSRFGGIQVYWKSEAATVTKTKPKFRPAELKLKDLMGLMDATNDLIRDASALTAVVNKWFPMEFGFKLDDGIINGTGAGQLLGIMNSGCVVEQAVRTGQGTRANNANKVIYENICDLWARMPIQNRRNAVWLINGELEPSLYTMALTVGTGGSAVFMPAGGASSEPYSTLFNRPIIPCEQCQAPGTAGDIILADLNEYILMTKGGIEAASSIHVRFIYDEMSFRWVYRIDGMPMRNQPLTPYKGSNTVSPFVTLAAS